MAARIEAAAGLLDGDDPAAAIAREALEEAGYAITDVEHVFDVYVSPGSVTERIHLYAAAYDPRNRATSGGGVAEEGESIELLELDID